MTGKDIRTITPEENELIEASMHAIKDLSSIYDSGLSVGAIKRRINRIAEDLKTAISDKMLETEANASDWKRIFSSEGLLTNLTALGIEKKRAIKAIDLASKEPMSIFYPEPTSKKSVSIKLEKGDWWMKVD